MTNILFCFCSWRFVFYLIAFVAALASLIDVSILSTFTLATFTLNSATASCTTTKRPSL